MPQGTVVAIKPSFDTIAPTNMPTELEWLKALQTFIQENTGEALDIGVVEICDIEGDTELEAGKKMLFILPKGEYPSGIAEGNCDSSSSTRVKFFYEKKPFRYINKIHIKKDV
ncbi:hypothetical protein ACFS7Z_03620 [Pontibacter toksunensis]|uniref:Uncharacterized protein n=1 Tax=Pontibacter toksunensis TaxID=1332631 RepID=A0ABW6BNL2_9BACT